MTKLETLNERMNFKPRKIQAYILVGPTASGKSSVAQLLAEQTGASVVSADSMNIYRKMDIGTAKPTPEERRAVQYYGVDLADPTESYSVGDWLNAVKPAFSQQRGQQRGQPVICSISAQNDAMHGLIPPVVVGGTGLYVKCLLAGLDEMPIADEPLRARAKRMTLDELQAEARAGAPEAYAALSDPQNPRRLVRLLEHGGAPRTQRKDLPTVVGLHVERDVLQKRIAARVDRMYAEGLIEEARGLMGLELSATAAKAIGYAEAFAVLRGEMTEEQAKERTVIRTRQLAKRQMTWFRNQLNVEWIDTAKFHGVEKLAEKTSTVWKKVPVVL